MATYAILKWNQHASSHSSDDVTVYLAFLNGVIFIHLMILWSFTFNFEQNIWRVGISELHLFVLYTHWLLNDFHLALNSKLSEKVFRIYCSLTVSFVYNKSVSFYRKWS